MVLLITTILIMTLEHAQCAELDFISAEQESIQILREYDTRGHLAGTIPRDTFLHAFQKSTLAAPCDRQTHLVLDVIKCANDHASTLLSSCTRKKFRSAILHLLLPLQNLSPHWSYKLNRFGSALSEQWTIIATPKHTTDPTPSTVSLSLSADMPHYSDFLLCFESLRCCHIRHLSTGQLAYLVALQTLDMQSRQIRVEQGALPSSATHIAPFHTTILPSRPLTLKRLRLHLRVSPYNSLQQEVMRLLIEYKELKHQCVHMEISQKNFEDIFQRCTTKFPTDDQTQRALALMKVATQNPDNILSQEQLWSLRSDILNLALPRQNLSPHWEYSLQKHEVCTPQTLTATCKANTPTPLSICLTVPSPEHTMQFAALASATLSFTTKNVRGARLFYMVVLSTLSIRPDHIRSIDAQGCTTHPIFGTPLHHSILERKQPITTETFRYFLGLKSNPYREFDLCRHTATINPHKVLALKCIHAYANKALPPHTIVPLTHAELAFAFLQRRQANMFAPEIAATLEYACMNNLCDILPLQKQYLFRRDILNMLLPRQNLSAHWHYSFKKQTNGLETLWIITAKCSPVKSARDRIAHQSNTDLQTPVTFTVSSCDAGFREFLHCFTALRTIPRRAKYLPPGALGYLTALQTLMPKARQICSILGRGTYKHQTYGSPFSVKLLNPEEPMTFNDVCSFLGLQDCAHTLQDALTAQ